MIVEAPEVRRRGDRVERVARVRWAGGAQELRCEGPAGVADESDDASAFLCAALRLAMAWHEDLEVRAPVSPVLLATCERLQHVYSAWVPTTRRIAVAAEPGRPGTPAAGRGAFLSRGVDSLYAAARDRAGERRLTHLVFVDGVEARHDTAVRAEEVRRAGLAARDLGLPLVVAGTDVRALADHVITDWADYVAPALSFVAHSLAGGLGSALIASADDWATLDPGGTTPLLDPLYSTERTAIEHGDVDVGRMGKVAWLAEHRPDLLAHLKVCFKENRPDNCGRCSKCLLTMGCLQLVGALERATGFPRTIDLGAVAAMRLGTFTGRYEWAQLATALEPGPLRETILATLRTRALANPSGSARVEPRSTRDHRLNLVFSLMLDGRPYDPEDGAVELRGLVRALRGDRHVYGAGTLPAGELAGELGSLHHPARPGSVPVWLSPEGLLVGADGLARPRAGLVQAARWVLAPAAWRELPDRRRRARAIGRRVWRALRPPLRPSAPSGPPAGFLHPDERHGRVPLFAGYHPITGDQFLTRAAHEAGDLGYVDVERLGWLDAVAPLTGTLDTRRLVIPWASRFGERVR